MNKQILIVVQNDLLGGAEQLLKSLAAECINKKYSVDVLIVRQPMKNSWQDISPFVNITYLNSKSYLIGFLRLFFRLMKNKTHYDIIFSSNININAILGTLNRFHLLNAKKLVIRETTSVFLRNKGLKKLIHVLKYRIGYAGANLIICQTDLMKIQFEENLKIASKWNLVSFQNPMNHEVIRHNSHEENEIINELQDKKYIVAAGRLIVEKGFDILINAYNELKTQITYDLIILGDGILKDKLENQIKALDLNDRVILVGHVENPFSFFRLAKLCIVSSRSEGFPNVLLQMSLLNNSVVTTKCAGNIEKIPGIFIAQPNDVESLKTEIVNCIEKPVDEKTLILKKKYLMSLTYEKYLNNIEEFLRKNEA